MNTAVDQKRLLRVFKRVEQVRHGQSSSAGAVRQALIEQARATYREMGEVVDEAQIIAAVDLVLAEEKTPEQIKQDRRAARDRFWRDLPTWSYAFIGMGSGFAALIIMMPLGRLAFRLAHYLTSLVG